MDWRWLIGVSITVGLATAGGIWALVKVVAALATEAATIKAHLGMVLPLAQELPAVKQEQAVHKQRLDDHDDEIDKLRTKVNQ